MLKKINVTKVFAGRFGPKFRNELEDNNIECIEEKGIAAQVVKNFLVK